MFFQNEKKIYRRINFPVNVLHNRADNSSTSSGIEGHIMHSTQFQVLVESQPTNVQRSSFGHHLTNLTL